MITATTSSSCIPRCLISEKGKRGLCKAVRPHMSSGPFVSDGLAGAAAPPAPIESASDRGRSAGEAHRTRDRPLSDTPSQLRVPQAAPIEPSVNGRPTVGAQHARPRREAAQRERDVRGDGHVTRPHVLRDPVVRRIRARGHYDELDLEPGRNLQQRVRHQHHGPLVASRGQASPSTQILLTRPPETRRRAAAARVNAVWQLAPTPRASSNRTRSSTRAIPCSKRPRSRWHPGSSSILRGSGRRTGS
jgi:hypothetical protein